MADLLVSLPSSSKHVEADKYTRKVVSSPPGAWMAGGVDGWARDYTRKDAILIAHSFSRFAAHFLTTEIKIDLLLYKQ